METEISSSSSSSNGSSSLRRGHRHHVLLFPFMSKGHTIPILHLARLLLRRCMAVTVITTPSNRPFIAASLADTSASIVTIPFPQNIPDIPPGVESTDALPSVDAALFVPFCKATKLMQPEFEAELHTLLPVSFIVSDGFLWWTLDSATKFGLPRLVFYGFGQYSSGVTKAVFVDRLLDGAASDDELITVTQFPWIKVTRNDFEPGFFKLEPDSTRQQLFMDQVISTSNSFGMLVNTFYSLEKVFIDHCNSEKGSGLKSWHIGPLCLAQAQPPRAHLNNRPKPSWIKWLDEKLEEGKSVLYVAFGSQANISAQQLKEIAIGLEESKVNFLWVVRNIVKASGFDFDFDFEERVKERGMVVREWVDQGEVLMHQSVKGFLSHCGWNSVLESICAGVPILAWPMLAEQPLNARLVAEEIKVGLRVETCDGSVKGFVKWEGLVKMVRELMEGEMGKEVRRNVEGFAEMAKMAMEEKTGSSWQALDLLINEIEMYLCQCNNQ